MFKKGLDYTVHDSKIDQNGRYIILDISLFDQRLTFVSLYGYNRVLVCDINLGFGMQYKYSFFVYNVNLGFGV
jgi:hypothetical protein